MIEYPDSGDATKRVDGKMLGLTRNGHARFILQIGKAERARIYPISFGHPAATDKDLPFVVRVVASGPVKVRQLADHVQDQQVQLTAFASSSSGLDVIPPQQKLHLPLQKFCMQVLKTQVLLEGAPHYRIFVCEKMGGTVFVYMVVADKDRAGLFGTAADVHCEIQANVRGMVCRTEHGLQAHETIAKGQKFQAAWRRYQCNFYSESESRLLMVLVQSGMDWEMGPISCKRVR